MDVDHYEEQFSANLAQILSGIGKQQQLFIALMRDVKAELASAAENDAELKRLILEQGETMRQQGVELRALRADLEADNRGDD